MRFPPREAVLRYAKLIVYALLGLAAAGVLAVLLVIRHFEGGLQTSTICGRTISLRRSRACSRVMARCSRACSWNGAR